MTFTRLAAFAVVYNLAVILFGAWVRITGSGAGCGEHWPTCHGDVIPRAPSVSTIIELTHRITSGLSLVIVIALVIWALRAFERGHRVRKASVAFLVFILLEAAVGAGLVLFSLVEKDSSAARAIVIAFHLVNTLGLLASGFLAAYWSSTKRTAVTLEDGERTLFVVAVLAMVLTGATGAVTALGDTLFPVGSDHDPSHFLVQLRVVHPVIAIGAAVFLTIVARLTRTRAKARSTDRAGKLLAAFVHTQVLIGVANILLKAPGWMQILHLLFANLVWLALCYLIASRAWPAANAQN
jgi:heme a synthase